jgi:hypothetical protein
MLQRYMFSGAALGWHVLWIFDRKFENALEAGLAHSMATCQFRTLGFRDIVRQAGNTFDPKDISIV